MDFLSLLCHLLIIGLSGALPLYTGGTFWQLGDTKYGLFRNLTCFCLGLWLLVWLYEAVRGLVLRRKGTEENRRRISFSAVDICMLFYAGAVTLSALFSRYHETAWLGYNEWYMGALSQLLFVGIYFFVSRCYDGKQYSLLLGGTAAFVVFALGICNRLGFDPMGLLEAYGPLNWEYSHMLSTVGNINWFCGYCSVALAFPAAAYIKGGEGQKAGAVRAGRLKDGSLWRQAAAWAVSVTGLTLLLLQGSDIGILLAAVCLFVCMLEGMTEAGALKKTVALGTGVCIFMQFYGRCAGALGDSAWEAIPPDGFGRTLARWRGWWLPAVLGAALYIGLARLEQKEKGRKTVRRVAVAAAAFIALTGAAGALFFALRGSFEGSWGNGRGALWSITLQGYWQNGIREKLIGIGPDCFAEYMYTSFATGALPALGGRWAGTLFANAHNEWLNQLINLGLGGAVSYLGIFLFGLRRYRRYLPGLLALAMYVTVSLTGFQQVLSTPLFFMTLGIAERFLRAQEGFPLLRDWEESYEVGEI